MKSIKIESSILPTLGKDCKEIINLGMWSLYSINNSENYVLFTDTKDYILDSNGAILMDCPNHGMDIDMKDIIYFSDLPFPPCVSELKFGC